MGALKQNPWKLSSYFSLFYMLDKTHFGKASFLYFCCCCCFIKVDKLLCACHY